MAERELKPDERVSIARATMLIRKANKEKADLLNDMLQEGNIVADTEIGATCYGQNHKGTPHQTTPKQTKLRSIRKRLSSWMARSPSARITPTS